MRKVKVNFRKSYKRFNRVQKVIVGFGIFFTFLNVFGILMTGTLEFWIYSEAIFLFIVIIIFYYRGSYLSFYMTKIELKNFYILGEKKSRKVEKDFLARHPFVRKFSFNKIVSIREYREDGTLLCETPYNFGRINGEVKVYSIYGKLRRSSMYKEDELDGYSKHIAGNNLLLEQYFKRAKLHGITKEYDAVTGKLIKKINYKYNKIDGVMEIYDPERGTIIEKTLYKNGIKEGLSKFYYRTGQLKSETPYKNNIIYGTVKVYYKSGILLSETQYIDGIKDGLFKSYYQTGQLKSETSYKKGLLNGVEKIYYKSGVLFSETHYNNDKKHGTTKYFDPDGKLQYET